MKTKTTLCSAAPAGVAATGPAAAPTPPPLATPTPRPADGIPAAAAPSKDGASQGASEAMEDEYEVSH
jgi:hypothetical protein